ncbi:MAG: peptide chain release factor N(5)-glutamine methyltransferase [Maricaulaceae bacterium]
MSLDRLTADAARREAVKALEAAGVDPADARTEARALLKAAAGGSAAALIARGREGVSPVVAARFAEMLARRARRTPLAHILGETAFWKFRLKTDARALIPRPETEEVANQALTLCPTDRPVRVLDLGVGTGALLFAVLVERPLAFGVGLDRSEDALALARENAARLGLAARCAFVCGDWLDAVGGPVDLVLANPPYIETETLATLEPEVRDGDPRLALDGGVDGLAAYRRIGARLGAVTPPGRRAVFELGAGQGAAVKAAFDVNGSASVEIGQDVEGRDRWAIVRLEAAPVLRNRQKPVGNS